MSAWICLGIANVAIADLCANHGVWTAMLLRTVHHGLSVVGLN